jgi:hypothetical protein
VSRGGRSTLKHRTASLALCCGPFSRLWFIRLLFTQVRLSNYPAQLGLYKFSPFIFQILLITTLKKIPSYVLVAHAWEAEIRRSQFQISTGKNLHETSHLNGEKLGVVVHACHPSNGSGKPKIGGS